MTDLHVTLAGETLVLLPERAAWWPAHRTLLVADVHLGKSSVFRSHGIAVPAGSTEDNLARLDACLSRYAADRLICLGDLTHARGSHTPRLDARLSAWKAQHPALRIELVRGNHDRHAGVPAALDAVVHEAPLRQGPLLLCHDIDDADDDGIYRICGHVHPAIVLGAHGDSARLPCFAFGPRTGVLPAFGAMTGMHTLQPDLHTAYYAIADDRVFGPLFNTS